MGFLLKVGTSSCGRKHGGAGDIKRGGVEVSLSFPFFCVLPIRELGEMIGEEMSGVENKESQL